MSRAARALVAGGLLLAAGGSGTGSTGTLTVRSVLTATKGVSSYRFSDRSTVLGISLPPYTGKVDADAASVIQKVTVRGTPTVHYSLVGAKPPVDIWVDDHDRLRRLV